MGEGGQRKWEVSELVVNMGWTPEVLFVEMILEHVHRLLDMLPPIQVSLVLLLEYGLALVTHFQ